LDSALFALGVELAALSGQAFAQFGLGLGEAGNWYVVLGLWGLVFGSWWFYFRAGPQELLQEFDFAGAGWNGQERDSLLDAQQTVLPVAAVVADAQVSGDFRRRPVGTLEHEQAFLDFLAVHGSSNSS
jgi:hypothetical protein